MQLPKPVGRGAASRKYDVLTALGAYALASGKSDQKLGLRFITLITARYNWTRDLLSVGQREIAQLWSVDERTVKREMAKLRGKGWLVLRRQGARGRVTEYALGLEAILDETQGAWPQVGPDFVMRMEGDGAGADVVPLPVRGTVTAPVAADGTEWAIARTLLYQEDAGTYGAWIAALTREARQGGTLILRAPSRFHAAYVSQHLDRRILSACQSVDDGVAEVRVLA